MTMVYVVNHECTPMMPTKRYGKVRKMLNSGQASIYKRKPFTIKLNYKTKTNYVQKVSLGVDTHLSKTAMSAMSPSGELFGAEIDTRKDSAITIRNCRLLRQSRRKRNSKRKPRQVIRGESRRKKSIYTSKVIYEAEVLHFLKRLCLIMPIFEINMEVAEAPIFPEAIIDQHIGRLYTGKGNWSEEGESILLNRNYTLLLDHHTCQCCHKKPKNGILRVMSTRDITNYEAGEAGCYNEVESYSEMTTICEKCKRKYDKIAELVKENDNDLKKREYNIKQYRKEFSKLIKKRNTFRKENPIKLSKIKHNMCEIIAERFSKYGVKVLRKRYGITTKMTRIERGLPYSPINNARILASTEWEKSYPERHYYIKFRKHHDRSLHKITPNKGGVRLKRTPKILYGFSSYDEVKYIGNKHPNLYGKKFFITKRRRTGYFAIGRADGTTILNSVKYTDLSLVRKTSETYSMELI